MNFPQPQKIVAGVTTAASRFPFAMISALTATVVSLILIDYDGQASPTPLFKILFAAIAGIPLFSALPVVSERRSWNRLNSVAAHCVAIAALVGYALTVPADLSREPALHWIRLIMLLTAGHLFASVAPFFGKGQTEEFWEYNKDIFLRALTAVVFSAILWGGLALALAALDNLFGFKIPGKRYGELWVLILGVFNTVYFLMGVPRTQDLHERLLTYPKPLKLFVQAVLSPLALIYGIILYVYLAKILVTWAWPDGWVSKLIFGFSTIGTFSLLMLFPLRNSAEHRWASILWRRFYLVLIPVLPMLFLALWRRVSEYGVTEGRYVALVLCLWLLGAAIYFIVSRAKDIRVIPASLCVLGLFVSFGPWGAFSISEKSQVGRFTSLVQLDSLLAAGGSVHRAASQVPMKDQMQISSILGYLHDLHGYDGIQPLFTQSLVDTAATAQEKYIDPARVAQLLGIEYIGRFQSGSANEIVFARDSKGAVDTRGYDMILISQVVVRGGERRFRDKEFEFWVSRSIDTLFCKRRGNDTPADTVAIAVASLYERLEKKYQNANIDNLSPTEMTIDQASAHMKVRICLRRINLRKEDGKFAPWSYEMDILYAFSPA